MSVEEPRERRKLDCRRQKQGGDLAPRRKIEPKLGGSSGIAVLAPRPWLVAECLTQQRSICCSAKAKRLRTGESDAMAGESLRRHGVAEDMSCFSSGITAASTREREAWRGMWVERPGKIRFGSYRGQSALEKSSHAAGGVRKRGFSARFFFFPAPHGCGECGNSSVAILALSERRAESGEGLRDFPAFFSRRCPNFFCEMV